MLKISILPLNSHKVAISSSKFSICERKFSDDKKISRQAKIYGVSATGSAALPWYDVNDHIYNADGNKLRSDQPDGPVKPDEPVKPVQPTAPGNPGPSTKIHVYK